MLNLLTPLIHSCSHAPLQRCQTMAARCIWAGNDRQNDELFSRRRALLRTAPFIRLLRYHTTLYKTSGIFPGGPRKVPICHGTTERSGNDEPVPSEVPGALLSARAKVASKSRRVSKCRLSTVPFNVVSSYIITFFAANAGMQHTMTELDEHPYGGEIIHRSNLQV